MITEIITLIWFFLPAGTANMAPVFFKKINFLNKPVDLGKNFMGERLFGENKTYRGFFFGAILAVLTVFVQKTLYLNGHLHSYSLIDYSSANVILLGLLLGVGALFGDLVKSFFKRRFKIAPGKVWFPFDQIDWIVGANIFILVLYSFPFRVFVISTALSLIFHPLFNYLGYLMKLKKNKF